MCKNSSGTTINTGYTVFVVECLWMAWFKGISHSHYQLIQVDKCMSLCIKTGCKLVLLSQKVFLIAPSSNLILLFMSSIHSVALCVSNNGHPSLGHGSFSTHFCPCFPLLLCQWMDYTKQGDAAHPHCNDLPRDPVKLFVNPQLFVGGLCYINKDSWHSAVCRSAPCYQFTCHHRDACIRMKGH